MLVKIEILVKLKKSISEFVFYQQFTLKNLKNFFCYRIGKFIFGPWVKCFTRTWSMTVIRLAVSHMNTSSILCCSEMRCNNVNDSRQLWWRIYDKNEHVFGKFKLTIWTSISVMITQSVYDSLQSIFTVALAAAFPDLVTPIAKGF